MNAADLLVRERATAVGLVVYGSRRVSRRGTRIGGGWLGRSTKRMKKWFSEFF